MAIIALAVLSEPLWAGSIYQHIDKDGVYVFSDIPEKSSSLVQQEPEQIDPATDNPSKSDVYYRLIKLKANKYSIDPSLIEAVIRVESNFDERAVSRRGAMGLMQVMPATARDMGVYNPLNPEQNIEAGTRYLRYLLERFDGDLRLALAAYNAGPSSVERHGKVPPIRETVDYLERIFDHYQGDAPLRARPRTVIYRVVREDGSIVFSDTKTDTEAQDIMKDRSRL